jgi:hypothetical protein
VNEVDALNIMICEETEICRVDDDSAHKSIYELAKICVDNYFDGYNGVLSCPPRSTISQLQITRSVDIKNITSIIEALRAIPQPEQRTPEWYIARHDMLTASGIWKVFGSLCSKNSAIYERCLPLENIDIIKTKGGGGGGGARGHGNKYEPLSIMIYESMFNTSVELFGCITHPQYNYIGASPDGICTDPLSSRFGRMVEVKNIVNREITGIPLESYWIQMQFQMEVCGLTECDFVETRFIEYTSIDELCKSCKSGGGDICGAILQFIPSDGVDDDSSIHSVYSPTDIGIGSDSIELDAWILEQKRSRKGVLSLYEIVYWRLDQISVVLVERNRLWMHAALPIVADIWSIIIRERESGYAHRAPKRRVAKQPDTPEFGRITVLKLDT